MTAQTAFDFSVTEATKKAAILDNMENNFPEFYKKSRSWCRRFCYQNKGFRKYDIINSVTTDDLREYLGLEIKANGDNNIMGGVLRKGFKNTGERYASKTQGSHGNLIVIWQVLPKEGK